MKIVKAAVIVISVCCFLQGCASTDPLPSWNEGIAKESIVTFVEKTTTPGSADFVIEQERIAVFDNDGTLWSEQPSYFQ